MYSKLEQITFFLGRAICHQLPERTLYMNEHYFPVCARDTGIYIGIFSSLMFITILKRYKNTKIPNKKLSFTLLFLLFPLIVDGFASYLGFYTTTNVIRVSTGILFGIALPFYLIPLFTFDHCEKQAIPIIKKVHEPLLPLTFAGLFVFLTYHSLFFFTLIHVLIIGTLVFWVSLFFYLYFNRINSPILSITLSLISSIFILSSMSYIHSLIQDFY